jgi:hypothetical protein
MLLRVLGAITLGFSAYLHYDIARGTQLYADGQITLTGLFMAQAVVGALVVLWVLARGDLLAWLAFGAVAAASLAALLLSSVVQIPAIGPFPIIYDPTWYTEKYLAAASAGAACLVALVALLGLRRKVR